MLAFKVSLSVDRPIVLSVWFFELYAHPATSGKGGVATEADNAAPKGNLDNRADWWVTRHGVTEP
jgi:hypothetical protein